MVFSRVVVLCALLTVFGAKTAAARGLLQAPQLADATLLLTRIPGSDGQRCSGAVILKSNGQQLPAGVAVAYELNGVAGSKATNAAGRIMVVSPALPAGSTTCSLKLVSITSQEGMPYALTAAAQKPRIIGWQ